MLAGKAAVYAVHVRACVSAVYAHVRGFIVIRQYVRTR